MTDFTGMPTRKKAYAGANGGKIAIVYKGEQYMLKFPPHPKRNLEMGYTNSCISEHLGSRIFETVGIPVQETMLGTYTVNGKEKVANEDCNAALRRIVPRVDRERIAELVNDTPYISDLHKRFCLTMLSERREKILDKTLQLLRVREGVCGNGKKQQEGLNQE